MRTMEFPLIEHELARTGRRYSTYALRTVAIGLLALYMLLSLSMDWIMRQMANTESDELIMSFQYASMIQFGIVVLLTPILTANAIAREKQDRTFGLLTLANYRHYDVYLSKAASVMLHVGMLVLCFTPIQAIGVALGSIEGSELMLGASRFSPR